MSVRAKRPQSFVGRRVLGRGCLSHYVARAAGAISGPFRFAIGGRGGRWDKIRVVLLCVHILMHRSGSRVDEGGTSEYRSGRDESDHPRHGAKWHVRPQARGRPLTMRLVLSLCPPPLSSASALVFSSTQPLVAVVCRLWQWRWCRRRRVKSPLRPPPPPSCCGCWAKALCVATFSS